ncbi:MAG: lipase family protein [Aquabacterium sp.]
MRLHRLWWCLCAGHLLSGPAQAQSQLEPPVSKSAFVQSGPVACPKEADARLSTPDFYAVSAADVEGPPGGVIRCWEVPLPGDLGSRYVGYVLMYRTSTLLHEMGSMRAVTLPATGVAYVPRTPAVAGERPVLVNPHGTTAMARPAAAPLGCVPSRSRVMDGVMTRLDTEVPDAVLAAPDFTGLGADAGLRVPQSDVPLPTGTLAFHRIGYPFLSLEGHGRATIDLVRAVRWLPGAQTGYSPRWAAIGPSAGGHGAVAAAEVQHKHGYGGELRLLGVVAGAPTSELTDTSSPTAIRRVIVPMVLAGLSLEWRDLHPAELLIPQAQEAFATTANQGCMGSGWEWTQAYSGLPADVSVPGAADLPQVQMALTANSPGHQPTQVPMLIGLVSGDPVVTRSRTDRFVARMRGQLSGVAATNPGKVTYCVFNGTPTYYPWEWRVKDHAEVFSKMFGSTTTCTDPSLRPVTMNARTFLRTLFAAPQ